MKQVIKIFMVVFHEELCYNESENQRQVVAITGGSKWAK